MKDRNCALENSVAILLGLAGLFLFTLVMPGLFATSLTTVTPEAARLISLQVFQSIGISICLMCAAYGIWRIQMNKLKARQAALVMQRAKDFEDNVEVLTSHTALCVLDAAGVVVSANDHFERLFKIPATDVRDKALFLSPAFAGNCLLRSTIDGAIARRSSCTREMFLHVGEGSNDIVTNVTVLPNYDAAGEHEQTLLMFTDLTSGRTSEMDKFMNLLFEEMSDEIVVYDVDTLTVRYMNRAARERCDWGSSEARTRMISDTLENFDVALFRRHTRPLISGEKQTTTIEVQHPKGPVEIVTRIMRGMDGARQFVSSVRDLTHRREIESAKLQSVSMISHELRSPLASIRGSLSLLRSGTLGALPAPAMQALDIANRNSDRLLLVVNDILDLEKIRAGQMDFTTKCVSLRELLTEAVEINAPYACRYDVRLVMESPPEGATVWANFDRMIQVLTNLLTNAIKFSPLGGVVSVSVASSQDAWRISVADNGPGIPEAIRDQIGQPFIQHVAADGRKREGSGLGLTITKQMLKHHNTTLEYDSKIGEGTTFHFALLDASRSKPVVDLVTEWTGSAPMPGKANENAESSGGPVHRRYGDGT